MQEKVYVDRLFADHEETPEIRDFKEEIAANLQERVKDLIIKGLDEEKAFEQATAELGDITAIADEVGKKKRNEAIGRMYMGAKVPLSKRTAAGLTAASGLLLLAVGLAFITFFGTADIIWPYYSAAVLLSLACALYIYFGLTQETAAHYAMKSRRALAYGAAGLCGFLGAGLATVSFFLDGFSFSAALGIKMALVLPAICVVIFLLATESKRQKPWLKAMVERFEQEVKNSVQLQLENSLRFPALMINPTKAAKFGVASGGLWILAAAVFIMLNFAMGWQYAWLVLIFTLAIQVFMLTMIFEKKASR